MNMLFGRTEERRRRGSCIEYGNLDEYETDAVDCVEALEQRVPLRPVQEAVSTPETIAKKEPLPFAKDLAPVAASRERRRRRRTTGDTTGFERVGPRERLGDVFLPPPEARDPKEIADLEAQLEAARAQLAQLGHVPSDKSLEETEDALRAAVAAMCAVAAELGEIPGQFEAEVERLSGAAGKHPERLKRDAEARQKWVEAERPRAEAALALTRSFVPFDALSEAQLCEVLPAALAKRLTKFRALRLVRTHSDDIAKLHPSDLEGKYVTHGLDIVETRAVWLACREAPFELADADGRKMKWFNELERRLRELSEKDVLAPKEARNPAYPAAECGPFRACPPTKAAVAGSAKQPPRSSVPASPATAGLLSEIAKVGVVHKKEKDSPATAGLLPEISRVGARKKENVPSAAAASSPAKAGLLSEIAKVGARKKEKPSPAAAAATAGLLSEITKVGARKKEKASPAAATGMLSEITKVGIRKREKAPPAAATSSQDPAAPAGTLLSEIVTVRNKKMPGPKMRSFSKAASTTSLTMHGAAASAPAPAVVAASKPQTVARKVETAIVAAPALRTATHKLEPVITTAPMPRTAARKLDPAIVAAPESRTVARKVDHAIVAAPEPPTAARKLEPAITSAAEPRTAARKLDPAIITSAPEPRTIARKLDPAIITSAPEPRTIVRKLDPAIITSAPEPRTIARKLDPAIITSAPEPRTDASKVDPAVVAAPEPRTGARKVEPAIVAGPKPPTVAQKGDPAAVVAREPRTTARKVDPAMFAAPEPRTAARRVDPAMVATRESRTVAQKVDPAMVAAPEPRTIARKVDPAVVAAPQPRTVANIRKVNLAQAEAKQETTHSVVAPSAPLRVFGARRRTYRSSSLPAAPLAADPTGGSNKDDWWISKVREGNAVRAMDRVEKAALAMRDVKRRAALDQVNDLSSYLRQNDLARWDKPLGARLCATTQDLIRLSDHDVDDIAASNKLSKIDALRFKLALSRLRGESSS